MSFFTDDGVYYDEQDYGTENKLFEEIVYGFRPWGYYKNLWDGQYCKVKRIVVMPGHKLSYQLHHKRSEYWQVISGEGKVTLDDPKSPIVVTSGSEIHIPMGKKHRIENDGKENLIFIEIQTGIYFGEDDIERFDDDYGRT